MLVPVSGVAQAGNQARADRFTYLPQIGLCIALAWAVADVARSSSYRRWACGIVSPLVLAILLGCAWRQTSFWRDSETLWNHTLACTSRNNEAHNNLGLVLAGRGQIDEAITHFQKALEIKPDLVEAHNNLGWALGRRGQVDAAIAHYKEALKIKPDDAETHNNLGNALAHRGQSGEAIAHYEEALKIKPDHELAHYNLGVALAGCGQVDAAIAHFQQALKIKPDDVEAHNNLGIALARRGQVGAAIAHYEEALKIKPDDELAHYNLGLALSQQGEYAAAIVQLREAIRLVPSHLVSVNQLAWVLATCPEASVRNGGQAVELAQQAVQLSNGQEPAILGTLAAAYAEAGRFSEAVETAERAISLASARGDTALAETLRARLKLYHAGSPYHETPDHRHK
jgi:tetratricopeptide (TPR) repeat protein